jgi:hypothetical protein
VAAELGFALNKRLPIFATTQPASKPAAPCGINQGAFCFVDGREVVGENCLSIPCMQHAKFR